MTCRTGTVHALGKERTTDGSDGENFDGEGGF